jgi:hypothetical protein
MRRGNYELAGIQRQEDDEIVIRKSSRGQEEVR